MSGDKEYQRDESIHRATGSGWVDKSTPDNLGNIGSDDYNPEEVRMLKILKNLKKLIGFVPPPPKKD